MLTYIGSYEYDYLMEMTPNTEIEKKKKMSSDRKQYSKTLLFESFAN